jgi:hypothetical protein
MIPGAAAGNVVALDDDAALAQLDPAGVGPSPPGGSTDEGC